MMKISVKSMHFHMDAKLVAFIEKKLNRLNRVYDRSIEAEVHLKLQENGNSKIHEKISEIRLLYPGGVIVDKKIGKTFESAVTASVDTLKRQLTRQKEKISTTRRRGIEKPLPPPVAEA